MLTTTGTNLVRTATWHHISKHRLPLKGTVGRVNNLEQNQQTHTRHVHPKT